MTDNPRDNSPAAMVAIPKELLASLVESGLIHADQCKCLNEIAKSTLWQSFLNNSNLVKGTNYA